MQDNAIVNINIFLINCQPVERILAPLIANLVDKI